jgi:4-carboxymuconolactone decarboxylase
MPRIPYPDPADLSEEKRKTLEIPGPGTLNISRMYLHNPDILWKGQHALAVASVRGTTIEHRLREVLILRVAYLSRSDYELFHHETIARNLGLTEPEMEALRTGDLAALGEKEAVLARFVTEVVEQVSPSDEALAALRRHFLDAQVIEITTIVGYYMMLARVAAVGGIETEDKAIQSWT